jgi:hypothetical protein
MAMDKKFILGIVIVVVIAVLGISVVYSGDSTQTGNFTEKNVTLNVSFRDPVSISNLVNEIKAQDYYNGYDNETLKWIESLEGKCVFYGNNTIVIMDSADADKIPSPNGMGVADVSYYEIFSCDILENHSLGNAAGPDNVLFVNNVTYIKNDTVYHPV